MDLRRTLRSLSLALVFLAGAAAAPGRAQAQANVTFSGGLGVPLTLKLNAPVTYVVTVPNPGVTAPVFVLQGVGNFGFYNVSSVTLTYTINGGAPMTFVAYRSGASFGSVTPMDGYFYGPLPGVAFGDTVVLNAGTLTTNNFSSAPPASGAYQTFLVDNSGARLDAVNGVSVVPEPSTWALVGLGADGFGLILHRRWAVRVQ